MRGVPVSAELGKGIGKRGEHGGVVRRWEDDDCQVKAQVAERGRGIDGRPISPLGPRRTWLDSRISAGSRPRSWQWA